MILVFSVAKKICIYPQRARVHSAKNGVRKSIGKKTQEFHHFRILNGEFSSLCVLCG